MPVQSLAAVVAVDKVAQAAQGFGNKNLWKDRNITVHLVRLHIGLPNGLRIVHQRFGIMAFSFLRQQTAV
ncbi:hypothetical protein A8L48_22860 [Rhizobium rhizogenes]|nr:hypothetical protein B0909_05265 [Rhizobium rhizogenes]OAM65833.1 hypothetical protein A8L48_22860 [Rhizobium rhizogenes]